MRDPAIDYAESRDPFTAATFEASVADQLDARVSFGHGRIEIAKKLEILGIESELDLAGIDPRFSQDILRRPGHTFGVPFEVFDQSPDCLNHELGHGPANLADHGLNGLFGILEKKGAHFVDLIALLQDLLIHMGGALIVSALILGPEKKLDTFAAAFGRRTIKENADRLERMGQPD